MENRERADDDNRHAHFK